MIINYITKGGKSVNIIQNRYFISLFILEGSNDEFIRGTTSSRESASSPIPTFYASPSSTGDNPKVAKEKRTFAGPTPPSPDGTTRCSSTVIALQFRGRGAALSSYEQLESERETKGKPCFSRAFDNRTKLWRFAKLCTSEFANDRECF